MEEGKDVKVITTVVAPENTMHPKTTKKSKEQPHHQVYRYGVIPNNMVCQYYMNREKELYERACKIKARIKANSQANAIAMDMNMASGHSKKKKGKAIVKNNINNKDNDMGEQKDEKEDTGKIEEKQKSKVIYRYTLEEMKSYNPFRHYCSTK